MRPATVITISLLMLLIVGAAFYQIVIAGGCPDQLGVGESPRPGCIYDV